MPMSTNIASASADVLLAADALTDDNLNTLIQLFHNASNETGAHWHGTREMMRAVMELLYQVRAKRAEDWKSLERAVRNPIATEPDYPALAE